jgi:hypothetical protein
MPVRAARKPPVAGRAPQAALMGGRPATGQVLKPGKGQRSFALRVWAYGKREYITLGRPEDGWTLRQAQRELQVMLRDIDLGVWKPPGQSPPRRRRTRCFTSSPSSTA